jgi:hypothetical protein
MLIEVERIGGKFIARNNKKHVPFSPHDFIIQWQQLNKYFIVNESNDNFNNKNNLSI